MGDDALLCLLPSAKREMLNFFSFKSHCYFCWFECMRYAIKSSRLLFEIWNQIMFFSLQLVLISFIESYTKKQLICIIIALWNETRKMAWNGKSYTSEVLCTITGHIQIVPDYSRLFHLLRLIFILSIESKFSQSLTCYFIRTNISFSSLNNHCVLAIEINFLVTIQTN